MNQRRPIGIVIGLAAIVAGAALALPSLRPGHPPPPPARDKPVLLLLTSLPIAFGEAFALEAPRSPVLDRLEQSYRVVPIAAAEPHALARGRLLLMAQPRAQPAELLVALDDWVRRGGRLLLLADPRLEWRSDKPLGDLSRPPVFFADTGLLGHWGLTLSEKAGGVGQLTLSGKGGCSIDGPGLIARCVIGRGRVTVIADADFLDVGNGEGAPGAGPDLDLLGDELASLDPTR